MSAKIPQHNTPRGTWCRFSGCDSNSGICQMCKPEPALSARDIAALAALAEDGTPMQGSRLASKMRAAGRDTSPAAAHQAGASLARKKLAIKNIPDPGLHVQYEVTNAGREWITRYQSTGGAL
jgi:hypothetical protein